MQFQADVAASRSRRRGAGADRARRGLARGTRGRHMAGPRRLLELGRPAAARYEPALRADEAERLLAEWRIAVRRTLL